MRDASLPQVYLPGASGASSVWSAVLAARQRAAVAVVADYPGLGDEMNEPEVDSAGALFSWIENQLPMTFHLCAMSMGSLFALRLALEQPARIASLTLVAPTGGIGVASCGATDWRQSWVSRRPASPRWFVDDTTNFTDRLGALTAPTLIISGDQDELSPPSVGRALQTRIAASQLVVLPGATHDLLSERPSEIAALIERHARD